METQRGFQACQRQALSCNKVQLCAQLQEDRTIIVCCKTNDRRCCYLAWALYPEERSTIQLLCTQEHEAIRSMKIIEGNGCIGWPEPRLQHHLFQHIHGRLCVCARTCVFVCGQSHVYNQVIQAVSGIYSSGGLLACDQDRSSRHRLVCV